MCDIHVHFPAGAVSKDGPSAGVAILAALVGLVTGRLTRKDTAMTGELSLRGLVLPVRVYLSLESQDIHVHFPAGAVSKNGPSAGVAILAALVGLVTGRLTRKDTAMTGELSLRGLVLPVGGIKEKLTAAREAGFKRALIPAQNKKDLHQLPSSVKENLDVIPVMRAEDVLREALEGGAELSRKNVDLILDFMSKL